MKLSGVLTQRVRGFRVVDIAALVVCLALALTVYAFKTSAGAAETATNPRARSAKLRAAIRTAAPAWRAAA